MDINLQRFKYTFDSDTIELLEYVPNYNLIDDYKNASESVMKSSLDFRIDQLKKYGYFNSGDCMIVNFNYDFTNSSSLLKDYMPIMKKLIRDHKLNKII